MGRCLVATVAVLLVSAGAVAAAGAPPSFTLSPGQTRWFLPGALRPGADVACADKGGTIEATMPAPAGGTVTGTDAWDHAGRTISFDVQPNGAVEVRCGAGAGDDLRRQAILPYVIGRNGVGLIRGPNTLARVRAVYGPGTTASQGGPCRVTWRPAGLTAVFAGARCTNGAVLVGATVTGPKWSSLSGVRVGDPVGRMVWEDQTAKLLYRAHARSTWLLGGLGSKQRVRLLAVSNPAGRITSLAIATR